MLFTLTFSAYVAKDERERERERNVFRYVSRFILARELLRSERAIASSLPGENNMQLARGSLKEPGMSRACDRIDRTRK